MLRSHLYDYSDAYIVVKGDTVLTKTIGRRPTDIRNRLLAFENNAPFTNYISNINNVLIDNAEDLDIVMPMYNLLEYSKNYRKTTGSLWNYYRDEPNNPPLNNYNADPIANSKSFKYKSSVTGKTSDENQENNENTEQGNTRIKKNLKIAVPLKYLNNFWRSLDMPLIDCEVSWTLTWSENCVLTDITMQRAKPAQGDNPAREKIDALANATFKITDTKLYVSVVTLSAKANNNFLKQLKSGFKRTIKWKLYRSEVTNQTKTNHLNHLIDPTFTKVNRLFVLSFENEEDRTSFSKYYVPKVEIKDFNVLIDGKIFFDVPVKNKEEAYEKIITIDKNNDYTTGTLLDYEYFSKHYKLISINLSKQVELENPEDDKATMFFIIKKLEETTFEFSQNSVSII